MERWQTVIPNVLTKVKGSIGNDEVIIRQAVYTGAVHFMLLLAACALVALYYVFEMFVRPLLWATLLGGFLYPIKKVLVETITEWLVSLEQKNRPPPVGLLLLFLEMPQKLCARLILKRERVIALALIVVAISGTITVDDCVHVCLLSFRELSRVCMIAFELLQAGVIHAQLPVVEYLYHRTAVGSVLAVLVGMLWLAWLVENATLSKVAVLLFYGILAVYMYPLLLQFLGLPVLLCALVSIILLSLIGGLSRADQSITASERWRRAVQRITIGEHGAEEIHQVSSGGDSSPYRAPPSAQRLRKRSVSVHSSLTHTQKNAPPVVESDSSDDEGADSDILTLSDSVPNLSSRREKKKALRKQQKKASDQSDGRKGRRRSSPGTRAARRKRAMRVSASTDICLLLVLACLIHAFWEPLPWLIGAAASVGITNYLVREFFRLSVVHAYLSSRHVASVKSFLCPQPLPLIWSLLCSGDRAINVRARALLDSVISLMLIFGIVAAVLSSLVFLGVQLKAESAGVAGNVWDQRGKVTDAWSSIAGEEFERQYEQVLNMTVSAVQHWAEQQFFEFTGQEIDFEQLEAQLPNGWMLSSLANSSQANATSPWTTDSGYFALYPGSVLLDGDAAPSGGQGSKWGPGVHALLSGVMGVLPFVREHVNTLMFTVNAVIGQIMLNMRILWWCFGQVHSVVNFLVSLILFLMTLFQLLTSSTADGTYQPYNWLLFMLDEQGSTRHHVEQSIHQAIEEVFETSFKIALFHGLWCWLTYTLFQCSIPYVTSLLMACFAVTALIGTYWLSIPAVLELWLFRNKPIHAFVLFVLHLSAVWVFDPIIYGQIQGSHYYVTGLSVVGGVYFLGVEGVVIGPMLLCGILIFGKLFKQFSGS
eukprot:TRINITY_DN11349_c0_g1_i1.p1 TRINITY_DN11349_c0_g1~~TRINITY_DN11349_c0_g1_i1.p1  ORF type:complete len:879 (+),score=305.11 TRINITY_DN11349_c0_g1_i1:688-3324(+)